MTFVVYRDARPDGRSYEVLYPEGPRYNRWITKFRKDGYWIATKLSKRKDLASLKGMRYLETGDWRSK